MSGEAGEGMAPINKLVICGVGVIGGSFARALRAAKAVRHIVGIGRSEQTLRHALDLGVIDEATHSWESALSGADFVLLACPVGQMDNNLQAMTPFLEPQTIVSDVGSTKSNIIEAIYRRINHHLALAVPAHPIAGTEKSGVGVSTPELFHGKKVVVTPLPENEPAAVMRVCEVWQACGAIVHEMPPQDHDRVFAAVSHLPHLLAYALVHDLSQRANAEQLFSFAASGFRDFTRIAGSDPEMWRDICLANRQAVLGELDQYLAELAYLRALLLSADGERLYQHFAESRDIKNLWIQQHGQITRETP